MEEKFEIIPDESLNNHVPLSVRFKYVLKENGELKSYIQELEYNLEQKFKKVKELELKLHEAKKMRETDEVSKYKSEVSRQCNALKERNEEIRKLRLEAQTEQNVNNELKNLRRLIVHIENKYGLDIVKEKQESLK